LEELTALEHVHRDQDMWRWVGSPDLLNCIAAWKKRATQYIVSPLARCIGAQNQRP
jgi:hypothetical protein